MTDPIADFERDCADAKVAPTAVFKAASLHPSLWWRWRARKVSPTLKSLEAARAALAKLQSQTSEAA